MTDEQIQIVKKSWKKFRGVNPAVVGDLFYSKLFIDNPSLRKMFPSDMEKQYEKLIDMLNAIVIRLDKLQEMSVEIQAMAQRHVGYGVKPAHYKLVGNALLWTLEKGLGDDWTEDVKAAWTACYTILADTMIKSVE
ncbi:MAG TPA: globin family protein [Chitinophagaceae bacterium]|nr:globin family protein [Chitinophagaceae bacterium]